MGFMNVLSDSVKGGISGGLQGGISGAIAGAASNLLGGIMGGGQPSQEELLRQQLDYQSRLMSMQAGYNKDMARFNQELSKDMLDYSSTQGVRYLKEMGLNPALMYGKGGTGGSTAGAGAGSGVGMPTAPDMSMALNLMNMKAQIAKTNAETAKTNAETAKIQGVDTESTKAETDKTRQDIENAKAQLEAIKSGKAKTDEEVKLAKFNNWLNDIKKNAQYNGRTVTIVDSWGNEKEYTEYDNFETAIAKQMVKQMERDGVALDTELKELFNKKRVAEELGKDIQTLVGVEYAKINQEFEKSEQAKTKTNRDKWELVKNLA